MEEPALRRTSHRPLLDYEDARSCAPLVHWVITLAAPTVAQLPIVMLSRRRWFIMHLESPEYILMSEWEFRCAARGQIHATIYYFPL